VYRDQLIFATSDSRKFRVLDRNSGDLIYGLQLGSFTFSSPIIAGDFCYFGSYNGTFYGIDLMKREIAWNYQTRESAEDQHDILNEDLSVNLQKIFTGPTPADMKRGIDYLASVGAIISTPVIESGTIYFGTQNGTVYAVRQEER
jgi:outer membrane protein assembly factor BamB